MTLAAKPMMYPNGLSRFVSDLHLSADRPDLTARFAAFLADTAQAKVARLFILGDLFDAWIGDDDLSNPFNAEIATLIRHLADQGTQVFFIAGNRDFLLGDAFAKAAGLARLGDVEKVGAGNTALLIMHGDTLCTDDTDYQAFRALVRNPAWQTDFLARPLATRRAEAAALRAKSQAATAEKSNRIMDVNPAAVKKALLASGCQRLIHGHTHRPCCEQIVLGNNGAMSERWVLSDWETQRGDALELLPDGSLRRIDLSS
ncbi:MAG: UDP-2,3-diacylglucosamine diphosphatase [Rugosibacter sp.]|jgi:UDP-2,3-diacylglucosamine hydrolase